jgi:hypothetical protein
MHHEEIELDTDVEVEVEEALKGEDDPDVFQWPPTYSNWFILVVFQFGSFFS